MCDDTCEHKAEADELRRKLANKQQAATVNGIRLLTSVGTDLAVNEELDRDDLSCVHQAKAVTRDPNIIPFLDRIAENNVLGVRLGRKNRHEVAAFSRTIWTPNTLA